MKQRPKLDVDAIIKEYTEYYRLKNNNTQKCVHLEETVTPVTPKTLDVTPDSNPLSSSTNKVCRDIVTLVTPENDNIQIINTCSKTYKNQNQTLEHRCDNITTNNSLQSEIFEERVSIIEYDSGIPRCWAEVIAKMHIRSKPQSISQKKWNTIINNLDSVTTAIHI